MILKKTLMATTAVIIALQPAFASNASILNRAAVFEIAQSGDAAVALNNALEQLQAAQAALAEASANGGDVEAAQAQVNAAQQQVNAAQSDLEAAKAAEQAPKAEEVPAPVVEEPKPEEVPAPVVEEAPVVQEAPVVEEAPEAVEEAPAVEEVPVVEEAPAVEEPKAEETPEAGTEETPAVSEPEPATEEAPAVEEAPVVEEAPAVEEVPVVEEAPAVEEPKAEETPEAGTEETPTVSEPEPATEEAPAVETTSEPTSEEAPVTEEAPKAEETAVPEAEETPAEAVPAVEDRPAAEEDVAPATNEVTVKEPAAEVAPVEELIQEATEKPVTVLPDEVTAEQKAALSQAEQKRRDDARKRRNELLGAAAVGVAVGVLVPLLGGRMVEDQGDRVIMERNGEYFVRKDENALLRRDGVRVNYEELNNGLSRETMTRPNGVRIVTTRAPNGDILRRERVFPNGDVIVLIDSMDQRGRERHNYERELPPIDLTIDQHLYIVSAQQANRQTIERTFLAPPVETVRQAYSLRDVRSSERLRDSVRRVDLDAVQFDSGSATVRQNQIAKLEDIALGIADVINEDPSAVFLIEGHTDAVGDEIYNLALSDRRAETIALILIDSYGLPPENFVVEGYGESYLKIKTQGDEPRNRRVAIRNITPLLASQ